MAPSLPTRVHIRAPARLHMGFLDMNAGMGRRFGSLGTGVQEIATELSAVRAETVSAEGPAAERAIRLAKKILAHLGVDGGAHIMVREAIPAHAGLGSGTQLGLAVGSALARLYGVDLPVAALARLTGRGRRSGVGIGTFSLGGFVVDAGRGAGTGVPPVVARVPVPESWRLMLVLDPARRGLSGARESEAFTRLGAMPEATAGELCRLTLMCVLPALVEDDCRAFGSAITRIQQLVGDYFAGAQDGAFSSPLVAQALELLAGSGAAGGGQSSWGPTGFAVFASETDAFKGLRRAREFWRDGGGPDFVLCRAQNRPAAMQVDVAAVKNVRRR